MNLFIFRGLPMMLVTFSAASPGAAAVAIKPRYDTDLTAFFSGSCPYVASLSLATADLVPFPQITL